MERQAQFEVLFPGSGAEGADQPDLLNLWQVRDASSGNGETAGVIWRAKLPDDPGQARDLLTLRGLVLRSSRLALESAPERLARDLPRVGSHTNPREEAFSLESQPSPLARDLPIGVLQRAYLYRLEAASFGDAVDPGEVDGITRVVQQFTSRVQGLVGQIALVESSSMGQRLGLTRVAWSGDVDTWLGSAAGPAQISQHNMVLAQCLATRQAWLHFLLMFSVSIVRVGVALAAPTFLPLTIWTTWKYLQGLVEEYQRLTDNGLHQD
jgi:hypothetical protein